MWYSKGAFHQPTDHSPIKPCPLCLLVTALTLKLYVLEQHIFLVLFNYY